MQGRQTYLVKLNCEKIEFVLIQECDIDSRIKRAILCLYQSSVETAVESVWVLKS